MKGFALLAELMTVESLIAFLTLTTLEIVLGIDNVVFISILTGRLPKEKRAGAMKIGLLVAMVSRIILLFGITLIYKMEGALFSIGETEFSIKSLILIAGGLFLIFKSTKEIHHKLEGPNVQDETGKSAAVVTLQSVLLQVLVIDLVFSLDSVITAVGLTVHIEIMIASVIIAVLVMMSFASAIASFVERHPTIKVLALAFLILIGVLLMAEGLGTHLNRGYVYFAMIFSLVVELINMRVRNLSLRYKVMDKAKKGI